MRTNKVKGVESSLQRLVKWGKVCQAEYCGVEYRTCPTVSPNQDHVANEIILFKNRSKVKESHLVARK